MNYPRPAEHRQVANCQQNAQLGRPEVPQGKMKLAERISRQIRLDGKQQKANQQSNRDHRMHVSGKRQPAHHRHCADGIDHVVHVEPVTRSLPLAHARQGSVEAVAKPIHRETNNGGKQHAAITGSKRIANASRDLGGKAEKGQMVGVDPRGHAFSHPDESPFLGGSQQTSVDACPKIGAPRLRQRLGIDVFCKIRQRSSHNRLPHWRHYAVRAWE